MTRNVRMPNQNGGGVKPVGTRNDVMRGLTVCVGIVALLACSGCEGQGLSDARRNHILALDHGWVDITVKAPLHAPGFNAASACLVQFWINGEAFVSETANLAQAEANENPIGYRIVVPSGKLGTELTINGCANNPYTARLALPLEKNHLANVLFDGKALVLENSSPYEPASLDSMRAGMLKLQAHEAAADETLAALIKVTIAIFVLNLVGLLYVILRKKRP